MFWPFFRHVRNDVGLYSNPSDLLRAWILTMNTRYAKEDRTTTYHACISARRVRARKSTRCKVLLNIAVSSRTSIFGFIKVQFHYTSKGPHG